MRSNNLQNTFSKLNKLSEEKAKEVAFAVQKVNSYSEDDARIAVTIEKPFQSRISNEAISVAVEKAFGNKVRYLNNSIHRLSTKDDRLFGIFVSRTKPSLSMEQASASNMTQINDTVYQDDKDNIWTVHNDGETSYLVAQVNDNINELLGGLNIRAVATASHGTTLEEDFGEGRSLVYFDTKRSEVAFGIAVNGSMVYNPERETLVPVEAASVLMVDDVNKAPIEVAAGADKSMLLEYMRKLYGQNTAFFNRIKEIISKELTV